MSTPKIFSSIRTAVQYAVGILSFILCATTLSEGRFLSSLFFGIAALWIFPPTQRFLNAKFSFPRWVNWVVPISALLAALMALGMSLPTPNREKSPVQPGVKDTIPTTATAPVVTAPLEDISKHPMFRLFENWDYAQTRIMAHWVDSVHLFRPISSLSATDSANVAAIQKRWLAKTFKENNEYRWYLSCESVKLDSVVFTVSPKKAKEWILEDAEETQTWSWFGEYFAMLKSEGLPYLPVSIKFVRPKGMNSPVHVAPQGWEKAGMAYVGCTLYMGNYAEKTEFGTVKGGVKREGKKYVVVYS